MSHNVPFKSETKPVNLGATLDLTDFVPLTGPKGGRVVVDKFVICITGTMTVAGATWDGRDQAALMQLITVEQRDGRLRWNLSGYKSRIASIWLNGIRPHTDPATIAIGAAQPVDIRLVIPMTKPKVVRGKDFALPGDIFKKFTLSFATLGGAAKGATVLSAPALNVYILAEWHEESNYEFKAEDSVKSVDFNSPTQAKLALNGPVHDLFLCKEDATTAGASINAVTDARLEDLGTPVLTRQDLVLSYRLKNELGACATIAMGGVGAERYLEPVTSGIALPIIAADAETSVWDGKVLASLKIDVGTGLAGMSAVSREILDKSQSNFNAGIAAYGIDPNGLRMKTDGKTRRAMTDGWTQRQKMVGVWSAPLPKAA